MLCVCGRQVFTYRGLSLNRNAVHLGVGEILYRLMNFICKDTGVFLSIFFSLYSSISVGSQSYFSYVVSYILSYVVCKECLKNTR